MNILHRASSNSAYYLMTMSRRSLSSKTATTTTSRMYSLAIAREVPKSLSNAVTMTADNNNSSSTNINYNRAKIEHSNYLQVLRKYIPVLCLPPIDDLPDSMFVEDTVVAIGNKAVITNPGHISRRQEVDTIKTVLQHQLGMDVTDMRDINKDNNKEYSTGIATSYCDGGDVLYTGRHLFVGVSGERTNYEAISILQNAFDDIEVIPIPFKQRVGALHLKSIITHIDEQTLLVPDNDIGDYVIQTMFDESSSKYDIIRLPNHATLSCNVVAVNGALLAQLSNNENDQQTRTILQEVANERNITLEFVSLNEAAKCDGALTCCSVLLDL